MSRMDKIHKMSRIKKVSFAVNVLFIVHIVHIVKILLKIKRRASDDLFLILSIVNILLILLRNTVC